ncbi:MAG TPA: type IV-A pilus assembly ATPase PilB, partial [Gammaproteobacteria bacterium]|nr:type IV-A pilus assembly ATPase PilB [Gammaproteobacteria bacterium]
MATTSVRTNLTGLPRRLVADGLLDEAAASEAPREAAREKLLLVSYLVRNKKLDQRAVANAAAEEFGVPILDLDTMDLAQAPLKDVEPALIEKHHALPLYRRGRKLFVGVSDPTNLQALDEIKFKTGLIVDPVVVEETKLARAIEKAVQSMDTSMKDLASEDMDDLDISAGDD